MKKFEITANFIGNLWIEIDADNENEAKEKFINSLGAFPNEEGGLSVSVQDVSLNTNQPLILSELNMAFQENLTQEDVKNWFDFDITEIEK